MFVKPFLKWAGGKYRLLDRILPELPPGTRLVEPFAGSCAMYLNGLQYELAVVNDQNIRMQSDIIYLIAGHMFKFS